MREINPFVCEQIWEETQPSLRRAFAKRAGVSMALADGPFGLLTAEQVLAMVAAAGMLSWACGEFEAIAPVTQERDKPTGRKPFPAIDARMLDAAPNS